MELTVWLLWVGTENVVIPVEGEECAELHPSVAKFFIAITVETAGIDTSGTVSIGGVQMLGAILPNMGIPNRLKVSA